jgi:Transposase, Mutator family
VLDSLPKSAQPAAIAEIYNAEDKDRAAAAIRVFERQYGAKFPKTVKKITEDEDVLLAFFDYPAAHWIHLRTTNPIESTFSTVRLRTKVTRGVGSRSAALAMTFQAHRIRPGPLARGQRTPPGRPGTRRRPIRARSTRRTTRNGGGVTGRIAPGSPAPLARFARLRKTAG